MNEDHELTSRSIASICALACACASVAAATASAQTTDGALRTRPGALLGRTATFRGSLEPGRAVVLQRRLADGRWRQVARTRAAADGSFVARWRADTLGPASVRALVAGSDAQAAASPLTAELTVYRPARATWYGPGFYGRQTACGQTMSHALLGVAHRTLPCGTPVAVYFRGRTVTVPVIDRGPFANHARYDLTSATAQAVGLTGTSTVGVIAQRGTRMAAPAPPAPAPGSGTGGVAPSP